MDIEASGGSQNYAYTWNPSLYLPSPYGPIQIATPKASVIYNIVAHDIACPNYTVAHSFKVNVNHAPTPTLNLKIKGCYPLCLDLYSKTDSTSFLVTYDFGGSRKFQNDNFRYCDLPAGVYSLTVYTKAKAQFGGCAMAFPYPSTLQVDPSPGTQLTWDPPQPTTNDWITFNPNYKIIDIFKEIFSN